MLPHRPGHLLRACGREWLGSWSRPPDSADTHPTARLGPPGVGLCSRQPLTSPWPSTVLTRVASFLLVGPVSTGPLPLVPLQAHGAQPLPCPLQTLSPAPAFLMSPRRQTWVDAELVGAGEQLAACGPGTPCLCKLKTKRPFFPHFLLWFV